MSPSALPRRMRGVTLIQILISTCIGLSLSAALSTYFIQSSRSSREDINVSAMLGELGFATGQLTADIEMAGFWAHVHDPSSIKKDGTLAIATDCGPGNWYRDLRALEVLNNTTGASGARPATAFSCLTAGDVVEGTDIVAVKRVLGRVAGTDTDATGLTAGTLYLRTHDRYGLLWRRGGGTPGSVDTPYQDWEYSPVVYFVQKYAVSADESPRVPSLCRMVLRSTGGGAPGFARECVAQGVENLQIEIGVDDDEDGGSDYYTGTPQTTDLNRAATARLYLLVRSAKPDQSYTNVKTYQIGNGDPYTPTGGDVHYYRKTLSSEVVLRNPRALQGVAVQ